MKKITYAEQQPLLLVVVDTEEEFDWSLPPDRREVGVFHMEHCHLTQDICNDFGLAPCYVVDYPIASQSLSVEVLANYLKKQQCEIGAHLHPWVNPPFDEVLSIPNMYPGNLAKPLEAEKLSNLKQQIEASFGIAPISYKAGRYGFGPNTLQIIQQLGFKIDLSYCPPIDHSADGGPDYSRLTSEPFFFADTKVLEIPITGAFTGILGGFSRPVFNLGKQLEALKIPGILSRLGVLDRLVLSPEGYTTDEHIKLTKFMLNQGHKVFTWSFHSPTVVPGNTQYVTNEIEKQQYLDKFKRYFDFFFNELNGRAITPTELYNITENMQ